jgi:hypothetical protein
MRYIAITVAATVALTAQMLATQSAMKPTVPGTPGDPVWQGIVRLNGRTFVTDGGLALDAAIAKPARLPQREFPGKVLQTYLDAAHKDEYGLRDLTAAASGKTYTAPNGIALNATYINYLRRTLSAAVRLRTTGSMQPVVILANEKIVGVLMPVRQ